MTPLTQRLEALVITALQCLHEQGTLTLEKMPAVQIDRTRNKQHGDFSCNVAMVLAKLAKRKPRELAQLVMDVLPAADFVAKVDIAGPGFINFTLSQQSWYTLINAIRKAGNQYGLSKAGNGERVMVEFVSANPTGPLHVGHGRGAAYGDALVRVLQAAGYDAYSEYYVNDAGRQMDILGLSTWLRYLAVQGERFDYPPNAYQGSYVIDMANTLAAQVGDRFKRDAAQVFNRLPQDPEERMDTMIARAKTLLGDDYKTVFDLSLHTQLDDLRDDLAGFGILYDNWFSERSLLDDGAIQHAIDVLTKNGKLYEKAGALWFKSTEYGDEKDRVVMRANGAHTYFAADIAYHLNKAERGFAKLINIWGADHHGYVARVQAAMQAMGLPKDKLLVLFVQFANLIRGGKKISMSTRSGEFVPLRELRDEVGKDAVRFFYTLRKTEQHMDFDLDLAKSQSSDNPVYYVQYAHARMCSVFRQLNEKHINVDIENADHALLQEEHEFELLNDLSRYPEVITNAAASYEPHQLAYYLRDLANSFHAYYNAHPFLSAEENLRNARLGLVDATRQVIANGLGVLGVSAPEKM
ncbi:MAG: arginine--tRNA ligase [Arenicellales bacterium WSBS_2016_MAG_OTU3]